MDTGGDGTHEQETALQAGQYLGGAYESNASYRTNPTVMGIRAGKLRIAAERLTFVADNGEAMIDAPFSDVHSVTLAEMNTAADIWTGSKRHRIVFYQSGDIRYSAAPLVDGVLGTVIAAEDAAYGVQGYSDQKSLARAWLQMLTAVQGEPPPGLKVRKPKGTARYVLTVVGSLVLLCVVIVTLLIVLS